MTPNELNQQLALGAVDFATVINVIENHFDFSPTAFQNGETFNAKDTNNGSCKIFAYGKLQGLSEQATLNAFGDFYTKDVLENPTAKDHANIRNFMVYGWQEIQFEG